MYGITKLLVKVSEEIPSYRRLGHRDLQKIEEAEVIDQADGIEPLVITEKVELPNLQNGKYLAAEPSDHFEIDYLLEQKRPYRDTALRFVAGATTMSPTSLPRGPRFPQGLRAAREDGPRTGGRINNFIILGEDEVINTKLRFEDEFRPPQGPRPSSGTSTSSTVP
jgi:UDP-3-O-acyl-N-acetylglucosamine deacetylase